MPSVSEAVEAKAAQDMMASLAAYNGAVLTGNFAEFDEAATADQANAAAVMTQYEDAVAHFAQPWEQAAASAGIKGQRAQRRNRMRVASAGSGGSAGGGRWRGAVGSAGADDGQTKSSRPPIQRTCRRPGLPPQVGPAQPAGTAAPRMPRWAAMGRGDHHGDYESTQPAAALEGAGEPGAGLSDSGQPWLPAAEQNDSPFMVSNVSWGPDTAVFDELAAPDGPRRPRVSPRSRNARLSKWTTAGWLPR